jgi:hypothetical protein
MRVLITKDLATLRKEQQEAQLLKDKVAYMENYLAKKDPTGYKTPAAK